MKRFWDRVDKSGDCWLWTGTKIASGYGHFRAKPGMNTYVHRYSWEVANGPIPPDHDIHHKCGVRACVNPSHLEAMGHDEHASHHTKTHCVNGHELTEDNVSIVNRKNRKPERRCKICHRIRNRESKRKRSALNGSLGSTSVD